MTEVIFRRENLDKEGASFFSLHFDHHVITGNNTGQTYCQAEDFGELFCKLFGSPQRGFNRICGRSVTSLWGRVCFLSLYDFSLLPKHVCVLQSYSGSME